MKFFIFTKKQIIATVSIALAVVVGAIFSVNVFAKADKVLPIYCVETQEKKIALTFDAAWGNTKKVQNIN